MDFITIDFETATPERHSPCEIGLTFVENDEIRATKSWLIKPPSYPYFNPFNVSIHGITPNDVKDAPEFFDLWNELLPLLRERFLIAHNAGFDFSVLRKTLEFYEIPLPCLDYGCTCVFAKKVWPHFPMYGLKPLCEYNGISFNHHRAGADSEATAKLALKIFANVGISTVGDIVEKLQVNIGRCFEDGYKPCGNIRIKPPRSHTANLSAKNIIADPAKQNPESVFFEKVVAFTGTLSSMSRAEAFQLIADIGGIPSDSVTKNTDYLVVGQQDFRIVGQDGMSSKQRKAIEIAEKGCPIEILSEEDFVKNMALFRFRVDADESFNQ
jgi:DNA polymerase-3 subunit epsilon